MVFDLYAYWNGQALTDLMNAMAILTQSEDFASLLRLVVMVGFITVMMGAVIRMRGGEVLSWAVTTLLVFYVVLIPKVTVQIIDANTGSVRQVDHVPLGVAFIASVSSVTGHWLADRFESVMSDVDTSRVTRFGAVFPERVLNAIHAVGPATAEGKSVLNNFIEHCVLPEVLEDSHKYQTLLASTDIASLMKSNWVNPARFMVYEGQPIFCSEAMPKVESVLLATEIPLQKSLLGIALTEGLDSDNAQYLKQQIEVAAPQALSLLLGTSQTLGQSLEQSLLLTAIPASLNSHPALANAPIAVATQAAKAQGHLSSEISFRAMSEVAKAYLPKIRNLLEFIVIGAFPLVFVMMVGFGAYGGMVIRMYVTLFVWLTLWAPMAAIINYLIIHIDQNPLNQIVSQYGGVTLQSVGLIRELGVTSQAMAGNMLLLVPIIAYMIAKGSEMGAVSLANHVFAGASGAASSQASQWASGNVSTGNASVGTVSANLTHANQYDTASRITDGNISMHQTVHGSVTRNADTGVVTAMQVARSNLGVSAQTQLMTGRQQEATQATTGVVGTQFTHSTGIQNVAQENQSATLTHAQIGLRSQTEIDSQTQSRTQSDASLVTNGFASTQGFSHQANVGEHLGLQTQGGLSTGQLTKVTAPMGQAVPVGAAAEGASSLGVANPSSSATASVVDALALTTSGDLGLSEPPQKIAKSGFELGLGLSTQTTVGRTDQVATAQVSSNASVGSHSTQNAHQALQGRAMQHGQTQSQESRQMASLQRGHTTTQQEAHNNTQSQAHSTQDALRQTARQEASTGANFERAVVDLGLQNFDSAEDLLAFANTAQGPQALASMVRGALDFDGASKASYLTKASQSEPLMDQATRQKSHASTYDGLSPAVRSQLDAMVNEQKSVPSPTWLSVTPSRSPLQSRPATSPFDMSHSDDLERRRQLSRGVTRLVTDAFENKEVSMTGALKVLAMGSFYESPQARYDALMQKASQQPALENALIQVGEHPEWSTNAVYSHVEAALQASPIRAHSTTQRTTLHIAPSESASTPPSSTPSTTSTLIQGVHHDR